MTTFTIGRDGACDIVVDDRRVSRRHAKLQRQEGGDYRLVDLGSRNGTFVLVGRKFVRADQAVVGTGDRIMLSTIQTTVGDLLELARTGRAPRPPRPPRDRKRDTEALGWQNVAAGGATYVCDPAEARWPIHATVSFVTLVNLIAWSALVVAALPLLR